MVDGNERETPDVPAALNNFSVTGKVKQSKVGRSKVACPSDLQPNAAGTDNCKPPNRQTDNREPANQNKATPSPKRRRRLVMRAKSCRRTAKYATES
jgi:hypothetical protein